MRCMGLVLARNGRAELSNECLMLVGEETSKIGAVTSACGPNGDIAGQPNRPVRQRLPRASQSSCNALS